MAGIEAVIPADAVFTKDPSEVLDYRRDWSDWLTSGDTINASTWTIPEGITKDSDTKDGDSATVWLSGGTDGEEYTVTNKITTNGGRTGEYSFLVRVRQR
jgi:hypothetical protein